MKFDKFYFENFGCGSILSETATPGDARKHFSIQTIDEGIKKGWIPPDWESKLITTSPLGSTFGSPISDGFQVLKWPVSRDVRPENIRIQFNWFDKSKSPHREGAPSSLLFDGNGKILHERWYFHGLYHRLDGPAWITDSLIDYAIYGRACTKEDLENKSLVNRLKKLHFLKFKIA